MGYETTSYHTYGTKVLEEERDFVQKMRDIWEPLHDGYDFENATHLSIQHAGDLRFSVDFVFMGTDISWIGDNQLKISLPKL